MLATMEMLKQKLSIQQSPQSPTSAADPKKQYSFKDN